MSQEERATLLFICLADPASGGAEAVQSAEEASVFGMRPADIAATAPTVGSEPIESTVIANPKGGVGLHVITGELTKAGPSIEKPGVGGDNC